MFCCSFFVICLKRNWQHQQSHGALDFCTERKVQQHVLPTGRHSAISFTGRFTMFTFIKVMLFFLSICRIVVVMVVAQEVRADHLVLVFLGGL